MQNEMHGHKTHLETDQEFRRFLQDPTWAHVIGLIVPPSPGIQECVAWLEYTHYKPGTPRNDLFHIRLFSWQQATWVITSLPKREFYLIQEAADQLCLCLLAGVPIYTSSAGRFRFPFNGPNVYTFDFKPEHPVHTVGPGGFRELIEQERETILRITQGTAGRHIDA
jgi:hypothetical protein